MWTKQFAELRGGDRFFYANDPELDRIQHAYGISYKVTLSQLITLDAGVTLSRTCSSWPISTSPLRARSGCTVTGVGIRRMRSALPGGIDSIPPLTTGVSPA